VVRVIDKPMVPHSIGRTKVVWTPLKRALEPDDIHLDTIVCADDTKREDAEKRSAKLRVNLG
jgi:hypothetical protein